MPSRAFSRLAVVLLLLGVLAANAGAQETATPDYTLGPQDVFSVTIFGPGGTSDRFTVEADGTFIFPLLGKIKASGLTTQQLRDHLVERLRDGYFTNPNVTVVVEEFRSQRIFVVGEVKAPGTYSLTRPMTLVEALSLAGSTTPNAGGVAVVRRRADGGVSSSPVTQSGDGVTEIHADLTALQNGVLSNNPILQDGDTIAVPRSIPVYVFGHVSRPGEYPVGKDASVRQILSLAGGVSQRGAAGRIRIVRVTEGVEKEFKAELDDRVKPGDTIIVPERFF